MRHEEDWGIQEIHDKLIAYLRSIDTAKILAQTSPEQHADWAERMHCRSLRGSGVRMVAGFSPETRAYIEARRAEGVLR
jgi:hypothetical protein